MHPSDAPLAGASVEVPVSPAVQELVSRASKDLGLKSPVKIRAFHNRVESEDKDLTKQMNCLGVESDPLAGPSDHQIQILVDRPETGFVICHELEHAKQHEQLGKDDPYITLMARVIFGEDNPVEMQADEYAMKNAGRLADGLDIGTALPPRLQGPQLMTPEQEKEVVDVLVDMEEETHSH